MLIEPGARRPVDVRTVRQELGLTQTQLADLATVSLRTVQSCEQGWRYPSAGLEKMVLLLLMAHRHGSNAPHLPCWEASICPDELRRRCMAYRTRRGELCWILTGRMCRGVRLPSWSQKRAMCERCLFFRYLMGGELPLMDPGSPACARPGKHGQDMADD